MRGIVPKIVNKPRAVIDDFAKRLPGAVEEAPFTLFVCGPGPSSKQSAILRRYVSDEINKRIKGVTVVWGEHRDFLGSVGNVVLRRFGTVTKELEFALHYSDLILIFPDSPGSFVELGIFGMNQDVCPRLVIIFDGQYRSNKGFAIGAMGKKARDQKATIKFLKYGNRAKALRQIEAIVRKQQEIKYSSRSYASR